MIGEIISHYKILEKLGEGGMGVVYKSEDTKLKRNVALKFLPSELVRDAEAKKRFIQEAQTISSLDHPNICTIYEINETEDGKTFIAMACYDGMTLNEKIAQSRMDIDSAIDIALQIGLGLAKVHQRGIVHRDIKPANIFITNDGRVKILDFGLAKLLGKSRMTRTGNTPGTAVYMSPEQIKGDDVDQRSDIWSLGIILYEMLTGAAPFTGDYEQAVMYGIINKDPPSIQQHIHNIPAELIQIITRSLKKDPGERYQSVNDMLNDLKPLLKDKDKIVRYAQLSDTDKDGVKTLKPSPLKKKPWTVQKISLSVIVIILLVLAVYYIPYYPNPFNPTTNIEYRIPNVEHVELSIYNVLGQKVATLVNKKQATGSYQVQWDASGFASGIYIYQLKANPSSSRTGGQKQNAVFTKKLVLLK